MRPRTVAAYPEPERIDTGTCGSISIEYGGITVLYILALVFVRRSLLSLLAMRQVALICINVPITIHVYLILISR
jgi:hypothetical protein